MADGKKSDSLHYWCPTCQHCVSTRYSHYCYYGLYKGYNDEAQRLALAGHISSSNLALGGNPAAYFAYNWDNDGDAMVSQCQTTGDYTRVFQDPADHDGPIPSLSSKLMPYLHYMEQLARTQGASWSSIYLDAFGLGLMFTIAKPVYRDGVHVGVAATDVTLADIEMLIANEKLSVLGPRRANVGAAVGAPMPRWAAGHAPPGQSGAAAPGRCAAARCSGHETPPGPRGRGRNAATASDTAPEPLQKDQL